MARREGVEPPTVRFEAFRREYPKLALGGAGFGRRDFDAEADAETGRSG